MKLSFINSKTAVVTLSKKSLALEIVEVERIAEEIGQYGNIVNYQVDNTDTNTKIIYKLKSSSFNS